MENDASKGKVVREKLYDVCEKRIEEISKKHREELSKLYPDRKRLAKLEEQYHFWFDNLCRIEK